MIAPKESKLYKYPFLSETLKTISIFTIGVLLLMIALSIYPKIIFSKTWAQAM